MTDIDPPQHKPRRTSALLWNVLLIVMTVGCLVAAALFPLIAHAAPASQPPPALIEQLDKMIKDDGVPGITVIVFQHGEMLYRIDRSNLAPDAQLPVASASKWLTAALVMSVVDEGKLSLDAPIGQRLPDFTGAAGNITLRQILSFTSGQGGLKGLVDVRQDPGMSLADSARQIARLPLQDQPGTVFKYGSPALQIAGALVEQATGESWSHLFDERIARPLGMTHTLWSNPLRPDVPPAEVHNPNLQGGATTTAEDYGKFLTMLAARGVYEGHRILSAQSVDTMETTQTRNLPMGFAPPGGAQAKLQYALGNWCEVVEANGSCTVTSSPGALGTYPWLDRRNELYGIFFMRRRLPLVEKDVQEARRIVERSAAADPILP
jgi:CubicO group peptidase (beta-lactamase class C family)